MQGTVCAQIKLHATGLLFYTDRTRPALKLQPYLHVDLGPRQRGGVVEEAARQRVVPLHEEGAREGLKLYMRFCVWERVGQLVGGGQ